MVRHFPSIERTGDQSLTVMLTVSHLGERVGVCVFTRVKKKKKKQKEEKFSIGPTRVIELISYMMMTRMATVWLSE